MNGSVREALAGGGIPQPDGLVGRGGDELLRVGAPRDGVHAQGVAGQLHELVSASRHPLMSVPRLAAVRMGVSEECECGLEVCTRSCRPR